MMGNGPTIRRRSGQIVREEVTGTAGGMIQTRLYVDSTGNREGTARSAAGSLQQRRETMVGSAEGSLQDRREMERLKWTNTHLQECLRTTDDHKAFQLVMSRTKSENLEEDNRRLTKMNLQLLASLNGCNDNGDKVLEINESLMDKVEALQSEEHGRRSAEASHECKSESLAKEVASLRVENDMLKDKQQLSDEAKAFARRFREEILDKSQMEAPEKTAFQTMLEEISRLEQRNTVLQKKYEQTQRNSLKISHKCERGMKDAKSRKEECVREIIASLREMMNKGDPKNIPEDIKAKLNSFLDELYKRFMEERFADFVKRLHPQLHPQLVDKLQFGYEETLAQTNAADCTLTACQRCQAMKDESSAYRRTVDGQEKTIHMLVNEVEKQAKQLSFCKEDLMAMCRRDISEMGTRERAEIGSLKEQLQQKELELRRYMQLGMHAEHTPEFWKRVDDVTLENDKLREKITSLEQIVEMKHRSVNLLIKQKKRAVEKRVELEKKEAERLKEKTTMKQRCIENFDALTQKMKQQIKRGNLTKDQIAYEVEQAMRQVREVFVGDNGADTNVVPVSEIKKVTMEASDIDELIKGTNGRLLRLHPTLKEEDATLKEENMRENMLRKKSARKEDNLLPNTSSDDLMTFPEDAAADDDASSMPGEDGEDAKEDGEKEADGEGREAAGDFSAKREKQVARDNKSKGKKEKKKTKGASGKGHQNKKKKNKNWQ